MAGLFATLSAEEVVIVLAICCGVIVSFVKGFTYIKTMLKNYFKTLSVIEGIPARVEMVERENERQKEILELLIKSDKARLKGEILRQYQIFEKKGEIDSHSLEYISQMYECYVNEGGNSFIKDIYKKILEIPLEN